MNQLRLARYRSRSKKKKKRKRKQSAPPENLYCSARRQTLSPTPPVTDRRANQRRDDSSATGGFGMFLDCILARTEATGGGLQLLSFRMVWLNCLFLPPAVQLSTLYRAYHLYTTTDFMLALPRWLFVRDRHVGSIAPCG